MPARATAMQLESTFASFLLTGHTGHGDVNVSIVIQIINSSTLHVIK